MAATISSSSATELSTLTLNHILSDLETLSSEHALFGLAHTASALIPSNETSKLLASFEVGAAPESRKQFVELSHQLLTTFRTAQRLNTEQVTAGEVGLVLPSERHNFALAGPSSSRSQSGKGSMVEGSRTDVLHAKVAELQTQVDAWHASLQHAVEVVDDPQRGSGAKEGLEETKAEERVAGMTEQSTPAVAGANPSGPIKTASEDDMTPSSTAKTTQPERKSQEHEEEPERPSAAAFAAPIEPADLAGAPVDEFEDDDPWNDLT